MHFASVALRVKSNPMIVLDPKECFVLGLKKTIRRLKSENARLSEELRVSSSRPVSQQSRGTGLLEDGQLQVF